MRTYLKEKMEQEPTEEIRLVYVCTDTAEPHRSLEDQKTDMVDIVRFRI